VSKVDLCTTTGHKAGDGNTTKDWVVQGQEPTQGCDQLSTYEKKELDAALKQAQSGNVRWANNGLNSIYAYARMAGASNVPRSTSDGNNGNSNSGETSSNDQVISPSDPGTNPQGQGGDTVTTAPTAPAATDPPAPPGD